MALDGHGNGEIACLIAGGEDEPGLESFLDRVQLLEEVVFFEDAEFQKVKSCRARVGHRYSEVKIPETRAELRDWEDETSIVVA